MRITVKVRFLLIQNVARLEILNDLGIGVFHKLPFVVCHGVVKLA